MSNPSPSPERLTFDVAVCAKLKDAFDRVFLEHPEVKALSATVTWNGALNDAEILHGVWLSSDGNAVKTADGVLTSISQTIKMLEEQLRRGAVIVDNMREQVTVLATEIAKKHEEAKALQKAGTEEGQPTRPAGGPGAT